MVSVQRGDHQNIPAYYIRMKRCDCNLSLGEFLRARIVENPLFVEEIIPERKGSHPDFLSLDRAHFLKIREMLMIPRLELSVVYHWAAIPNETLMIAQDKIVEHASGRGDNIWPG